jgi:hypothetical protein
MAMDVLWTNVGSYGPTGLLAIVIVAILTGKLVPKQTMEDRLAEADKRQAILEDTIKNLRETVSLRESANQVQIESAKTVEQIVKALPTSTSSEVGQT